MKKRTVIPLLYALSFLMVSAGSGNAQMGLHPNYLIFTFGSTSITNNVNQDTVREYNIFGVLENYSVAIPNLKVKIQNAKQWIITTKINGAAVHDGDIVGIGQDQKLSVEFDVFPYGEIPDTESYCLTLSDGVANGGQQCLTLAVTDTKSAVTTDLPIPNVTIMPNPAGSYIFARGLDNMQFGYRYEIFSISGAEVRHGLLPADARINVQDLPSGAYRLLLFDSKRTLTNTAFTVLH